MKVEKAHGETRSHTYWFGCRARRKNPKGGLVHLQGDNHCHTNENDKTARICCNHMDKGQMLPGILSLSLPIALSHLNQMRCLAIWVRARKGDGVREMNDWITTKKKNSFVSDTMQWFSEAIPNWWVFFDIFTLVSARVCLCARECSHWMESIESILFNFLHRIHWQRALYINRFILIKFNRFGYFVSRCMQPCGVWMWMVHRGTLRRLDSIPILGSACVCVSKWMEFNVNAVHLFVDLCIRAFLVIFRYCF